LQGGGTMFCVKNSQPSSSGYDNRIKRVMKFNKDTQSLRNNINRGGRSGPQNKGITKNYVDFQRKLVD